jgi:hypothetical protein
MHDATIAISLQTNITSRKIAGPEKEDNAILTYKARFI